MSSSYDRWLKFYGGQKDIDWLLLKAQVKQESLFDPLAESHVGAKGLAQFMPTTWKWAQEMGWVIKGSDPFNPEQNLRAQAAYMRWLLDRFDQDIPKSLAAYNWGIGNVRKTVEEHGDSWLENCPEETQTYVARIDRYYDEFKAEEV